MYLNLPTNYLTIEGVIVQFQGINTLFYSPQIDKIWSNLVWQLVLTYCAHKKSVVVRWYWWQAKILNLKFVFFMHSLPLHSELICNFLKILDDFLCKVLEAKVLLMPEAGNRPFFVYSMVVQAVHISSGKILNWAGLLKLVGEGSRGLGFHPVIPRHVSEVRLG